MKSFKQFKEEVKKPTGKLKSACWTGYTAVGTKEKNGRTVPNCVPVKEDGAMGGSAGPTMTVGTGAVAGTGGAGGEPGVHMKKKKSSPIVMKLVKRKSPQA